MTTNREPNTGIMGDSLSPSNILALWSGGVAILNSPTSQYFGEG